MKGEVEFYLCALCFSSWSNVAAALGKCTADGSLRERDREEELSSCSSHDEDTSKPRERWDCESILSTYSNIYNHPKLITEPAPTKRKVPYTSAVCIKSFAIS